MMIHMGMLPARIQTGSIGAPNLLTMIPNNRFERSRGIIFGKRRKESMIGINQLRSAAAQPRVAQPHR
jgi:hypothetical protein